ncbi:hypothetical protein K457DRAFT_22733 [Linnemannia elongata AG-77]|uniref:Uncharacterized protein n=1 Tax=Linnemannia elongata AG-77 TaxID=1314771 RepID=A0A197JNH8_9FUNG|nr:hypothetical protein K457DRAFT_22733 [Linnemannia elongata AG-77]
MITSDTNDNDNTNNNNTTTATNGRIPTTTTTTTTTTPSLSATPRHKRRLPTTFKFRNLLSYIRLLILALAFVSLILDAITISFQTNVMSLEYEDVAQQAYLLLTPDLLAIAMIALLFIYPSSLFCGTSSSGSRKNEREAAAGEVEYVEEYYDYGDDDDEEEEEGRIKGGTGGEGVGGREGTAPTTSSTVITSTPETGARAGKATPRSQAQQPQGAISPSPSLSPATYNDNDSLQQQGRYNSQNTGVPSRLQSPPTFTLHSHRNLAPTTTTTTNNNGRQQLLHSSQDHDRITTASTFDTAATTLSPPSISPSPADPTSKLTRTIKEKEQQQQHTQEQPTAAAVTPAGGQHPIGVSLAEMIAQEEKDETNRKRKRARLYTIARVTFSLGLTILALYWPAGQFKAPMGKQNTPPSMGEHQPIQGNNTLTYNYTSPLTPPPSRMTPTFTAVPSPTSIPTNTIVSRSGPTPAPQFNDGMGTNLTRASADTSTTGYYTGFRHKRGGHPKDSSWCAEEESFGDDESAAVYCRAKVIRPVVTYIWSVFLIVELCIAAMAGDFSKHGIRRRKQSFGDEGMEDYYRHPRENQQQEEVVVVGGGDVEKLSGREADVSHGQSVQTVSISDGSAAGTGAGVHQPRHHHRPGSRAGY